ncbi:hypothetical protein HPB47_015838 [Ixodes persulcatus]|uniref:Uncharacterized protein n=1 Tax=Ixodes persulcatus TaxID=34615 RepID=A0AC60QSI1_IXOPE|nr:hypothetical protein HPB47_015838 [Ixodes persulcatus]
MQRLSVYVDSKLLRRPGREKLLHSVKNAKRTRIVLVLNSDELQEMCHLVSVCDGQAGDGIRQGPPKSHTPEETSVVVPLGPREERVYAPGSFVAPGRRAKVVVLRDPRTNHMSQQP